MTKMSEPERAHLERLFEGCKARHKKGRSAFKTYGGFDLYGRDRWTREVYRRFVSLCDKESISGDVDEAGEHDAGSPFSITLSDILVSAKRLLAEAVVQFGGKYILFTWVGASTFRLTWIELKDQSNRRYVPAFEARRKRDDGIVFHGDYYAHGGTLFLFGHKTGSPRSRSLYLSRSDAHRDRDLIGVVSGASDEKRVFASACYATALKDDDDYADFEKHLDAQDISFVDAEYPHVLEALRRHQGVQLDFPRGDS